MKLKLFGNAACVVLIVVVSACADPTTSDIYLELQNQVELSEKNLAEVQGLLREQQSEEGRLQTVDRDVDQLTTERDALLQTKIVNEKRLTDLVTQLDALLADPKTRQLVVSKMIEPACSNLLFEYNKILGTQDASPRPDLNLVREFLTPVERFWNNYSWAVTDQYPNIKLVRESDNKINERCSRAGMKKFRDDFCESFDRRVLKKDTDRFRGKCLTGKVKIIQMDAATGPCAFQGNISGDYNVRAQFGMRLNPNEQFSVTNCEFFESLVENMTITFWAFSVGTYTYENRFGTHIVPAFKLVSFAR